MKPSSGINWYDIDGKPLEDYDQIEALLRDFNYKNVAKTVFEWGGRLSTVWLGLDQSMPGGKPLIFESMLFGPDGDSIDMWRYSTKEEALKSHEELVKVYSDYGARVL